MAEKNTIDPASTKVLIIDDDPFILDMYVLKFKDDGFNLDTASDGAMGVEKAKSF